MARSWLLVLMLGAMGVVGGGTSMSRTTTVSLSIPAIAVLSLPELNISGKEAVVELRPQDLAQGSGFILLEVKSNVPWAVTARLLSQERAELAVEVVGGPEVTVGAEEVSLLLGRPGRHKLRLHLKMGAETWLGGAKLVLHVVHSFLH